MLSTQLGTLVKFVRVPMLGPVVFGLSVAAGRTGTVKLAPHRLVPWFILGFLALAGLRSIGLVPDRLLGPLGIA